MNYREIKTLKAMVESVLQDIPETRNSDIMLTIEIWKRFYPEKMRDLGTRMAVCVSDLYYLPREDNVKRARAFFQNDKSKYLPTDPKIAKARGINTDEWLTAMGYPTRSTSGTTTPSWVPPSEVKKPEQVAPKPATLI